MIIYSIPVLKHETITLLRQRFTMLFRFYLWITIAYLSQETLSQSPCTLPTQFQNSVWVDSDKGELVFDTENMTGWDFKNPDLTQTIFQEWECYYTGTVGSKLYLILRCKENITFSGTFTPYLCMELTEVSPYLNYYYLLWAEEGRYEEERITTRDAASTVSDAVRDLCLNNTNPAHTSLYPETGEYHVLVKKGNEVDAKQECPSTFFGEYSYKVTDIASGTDYCGSGDEIWDVCTDYSRMTFNNSTCNTEISYSANGSVFCLVSITSGSYVYHTVYNEDNTVDFSSNTYRFTCFMSVIASDGSLNVSQTPGSCKKGQTPNTQPEFASNNSVAGLNMQLTPRVLCPKTSDASGGGLSTGAIVGIVFGILIIIAAGILILLVCMKMKKCRQPKRERRQKDEIAVKSPRSKKDYIVERLPDIQEDDENIKRSTQNVKEVVIHSLQLENSVLQKMDKYTEIIKVANNGDNSDCYFAIIKEVNEEGEVETKREEANVQNSNEINIDVDIIEDIKSNAENGLAENEINEIKVTRVIQNVNVLQKDVPHLNSTENIFSEYDAAMSYKTERCGFSKSDLSLNLKGTDNIIKGERVKGFEFTRDDSDIQLKSASKVKAEKDIISRINKSEGNLTDAVKREKLKRRSSHISSLRSKSFEWNFSYISPYSLSEKQKQEILERKIRLQNQRKRLERRKREEREERQRENTISFEKWKQRKRKEAATSSNKVEIGSLNPGKSKRYKFWYPY